MFNPKSANFEPNNFGVKFARWHTDDGLVGVIGRNGYTRNLYLLYILCYEKSICYAVYVGTPHAVGGLLG